MHDQSRGLHERKLRANVGPIDELEQSSRRLGASGSPLIPRKTFPLAAANVAQGLNDREIAAQLVLSPHTVHRHVANIRHKLGRGSRTAAVAEAARLGLL